MKFFRIFSAVLFTCLLAAYCVTSPAASSRPNFLIILADDCTYNDLPVYGGPNAQTPHIDSLATQGLVFNHAYLAMSICQPCRSELYSGQYPLHNGCAWNHAASRPETRSLPHYLGALGYRVGIAGKTDVFPKANYPFEDVPGFDPNCVDNPTKPHSLAGMREFISRDTNQPFCLVIGLVEPHVPWVMGDPSKYPPAGIKLPLNIADTKKTRVDFGKYLAEITYMDGQVGEILATLAAAGLDTNTLVFFTSEQGSQFPGNKWTCWDSGQHTGLIARWPGKITTGRRTGAVVQYADVLPTILDIAGETKTEPAIDGTSFSAVLLGKTDTHRAYAYGIHDNFPEGPPYPSRTVTDGQWRYIQNLTPNELYIQRYIMGSIGNSELNNPYWNTWMYNSPENTNAYRLIKRYMLRPAEELYDSADDPFNMNNVVANPKFADIKKRLSAELDRWLASQNDPGAAVDTPGAVQNSRNGKFDFSVSPASSGVPED